MKNPEVLYRTALKTLEGHRNWRVIQSSLYKQLKRRKLITLMDKKLRFSHHEIIESASPFFSLVDYGRCYLDYFLANSGKNIQEINRPSIYRSKIESLLTEDKNSERLKKLFKWEYVNAQNLSHEELQWLLDRDLLLGGHTLESKFARDKNYTLIAQACPCSNFVGVGLCGSEVTAVFISNDEAIITSRDLDFPNYTEYNINSRYSAIFKHLQTIKEELKVAAGKIKASEHAIF